MVSKWVLLGAVAAVAVGGVAVAYGRPGPSTEPVDPTRLDVKTVVEPVDPALKIMPTIKEALGTVMTDAGAATVVASTTSVTVEGTGLPGTQTLQAAAQLIGAPVISSTSVAALGSQSQPLLSAAQRDAEIAAYTITYFGQTVVGRFTGYDGSGQAQIIPRVYEIVGYDSNGLPLYQYAELRQILISPTPPERLSGADLREAQARGGALY